MSQDYLDHIANEGERWDSIAYAYYGDALNYDPIIKANPELAITAKLKAGQLIRVPIIEALNETTELPPPWLRD